MKKPIKIKILLLQAGISQTQLARELGVHLTWVNHIIRGVKHNRRVERHIARRLRRPVDELFDAAPPPRKRGRPAQIKEAS